MKQKFIISLAALALAVAPAARSQPSPIWENWGQITNPRQIDALTFINHAGAILNYSGSSLFDTSDTLNYTNQGIMNMTPGMIFETRPASTGQPRMAANFANLSGGIMNFSGFGVFTEGPVDLFFFGFVLGNSQAIIRATNIVNAGAISMSASSLIQLTGKDIDLSRGNLNMTNATSLGLFSAANGILDGYWGVGTANADYFKNPPVGQASLLSPSDLVSPFPSTQFYNITNRNYFPGIQSLFFTDPVFYINDTTVESNRVVQVVVLQNADPAFVNKVLFTESQIAVQWQWSSTNLITRAVNTNNYLLLTDNFGSTTNLEVVINGRKNPQAPYPSATFKPINFDFFSSRVGFPGPGVDPSDPEPDLFGAGVVTNDYAAYQAILTPTTSLASDVAGGNATNMAGRIELNASGTLNLSQARIAAVNYLLVNSTNHYLGSPRAQISAPYMDILLATTNGTLTLTNLVLPTINQPEGTIDLWSARWTNEVDSITNTYHVLFVDSQISPVSPVRVQKLSLSVTNSQTGDQSLIINDQLNLTDRLLLNAQRLTIATNGPGAVVPAGGITLLNSDIVWSTATPGLQYLTNWGTINTLNAVYFGGSRSEPPFSPDLVDVPYVAFVNHGRITNFATLVWANYFENTGVIQAESGSVVLRQADTVVLRDGLLRSRGGDVSITANNLSLSNFVIRAGAALDLSVTGVLDDSSLTNTISSITRQNAILVNNGMHLTTLPNQSSLLATTITNIAISYNEIVNTWAGADRGCVPAGFDNNAAVGHLILDGRDPDSLFTFAPATGNNALYVDLLEFRNYATNTDSATNFVNINIAPGMKIYYGQAIAAGQSIAEALNGKNNGGFCWVSNYAGFYSGTNVVYPGGSTNLLNTALLQSCTIDSDGDTIVNCIDSTPVLVPSTLNLSVSIAGGPTPKALVSWNTVPWSTNYLYCAGACNSTNWQLVTNFVRGSTGGRVTIADPLQSNRLRFYKARVAMP